MTLRGARALDWHDERYAVVPDEVGNRVVFEARLSWRLDRLLYEPAEPRLAGLERETARARVALDEEVTVLYFRWLRAELEAAEAPERQLDADEAWALLDLRTGGRLGDRDADIPRKLAEGTRRCPN